MSRRILYIIDSLKIGGAEVLLLALIRAAHDAGDRVHVAYFSPGPLEREVTARGVGITRLSRHGLRDPRALLRAMRLIRRFDPDIVHTHLVKSDLVGQVAARMSGRRRVVTLHNTDPWRRRRILSALYNAATAGANACIAVSDKVAEHVAQSGGHPRHAIETIVNGIDLDRFDAARVQPLDLARYGVRPGAVVAAVVGRLTEQKDHDNFLRAAAALAPRDPRLHFLIVGEGPLRDDIEARAKALHIAQRVTFTGAVREMPQLLAAVDILVLSSLWEGLPMTMLEGMAMARPVVATAVGGIPDVVKDKCNGRLVPPSDPARLAEAIGALASDSSARRRLGAAARNTVAERFDGDLMWRRICAVYDARPVQTRAGLAEINRDWTGP